MSDCCRRVKIVRSRSPIMSLEYFAGILSEEAPPARTIGSRWKAPSHAAPKDGR